MVTSQIDGMPRVRNSASPVKWPLQISGSDKEKLEAVGSCHL